MWLETKRLVIRNLKSEDIYDTKEYGYNFYELRN